MTVVIWLLRLAVLLNVIGAYRQARVENWVPFTVCVCMAMIITTGLIARSMLKANRTINRITQEDHDGR